MQGSVFYAFLFSEVSMIEKQESVTAKLCTFVRAWHSNRSHMKIFDDYLAYDIMGKDEYDEMYSLVSSGFGLLKAPYKKEDTEAVINEYLAPIPLSRIHFFETRLKAFAEKHGRIQYVICGAGYDTFAFRNTDPNIHIFEIDHPDTQKNKLEKIRRLEWNIPKNLDFVSVDFEKEKMSEKLLAAGFDRNVKTFFCIPGVTYYLTLPVFTDTLSQMAELSSAGSAVTFDYPEKGGKFPSRVHRLEKITHGLGEVMQGGYSYEDVSRALYSLGFQIDTFYDPKKIDEQYFSGRTDGLRAYENVDILSAVYTGGFDYE